MTSSFTYYLLGFFLETQLQQKLRYRLAESNCSKDFVRTLLNTDLIICLKTVVDVE